MCGVNDKAKCVHAHFLYGLWHFWISCIKKITKFTRKKVHAHFLNGLWTLLCYIQHKITKLTKMKENIFFSFKFLLPGQRRFISIFSITYLYPCFGDQMQADGQGYRLSCTCMLELWHALILTELRGWGHWSPDYKNMTHAIKCCHTRTKRKIKVNGIGAKLGDTYGVSGPVL